MADTPDMGPTTAIIPKVSDLPTLSNFLDDLLLDGAAMTDAAADALSGGAYDPDLAARVYADQSGQQANLSELQDAENQGKVIGPAATQSVIDVEDDVHAKVEAAVTDIGSYISKVLPKVPPKVADGISTVLVISSVAGLVYVAVGLKRLFA